MTKFDGAEFKGTKKQPHVVAAFEGSSFHHAVSFECASLPYTSSFANVTFHGDASFRQAKVTPNQTNSNLTEETASFCQAKFSGEADFSEADFGVGIDFQSAGFQGKARFEKAQFQRSSTFDSAKFQNETSFRKASFGVPPKFFETEIHENVDFSRVEWSEAERSYKHSILRVCSRDDVERNAGAAARAWDRLELIMSKQEKYAERHEFFRLRMRAQRQRDGFGFATLADLLYDYSSDYGWGVGRAIAWWFGHIAVGAVVMCIGAVATNPWSPLWAWTFAWNSLLVSFANSLAFLRLGSDGGYLNGSYEFVKETLSDSVWVFSLVGTIQAILGPILLFLVLLTLRNRLRLG